MCRIAGYLGTPVTLDTLLTVPEHSLREQARHPRALPPGITGSDGFGVGWFAEHSGEAARLRSTLPIWADENVASLAPHVRSRSFVASSRTASREMPVSMTNTPPFLAGRALLVHNGAVRDFPEKVLDRLRAQLTAQTRARIFGNTDTEYIAALLADRPEMELVARVRSVIAMVTRAAQDAGVSAQLNLIVCEPEQLVASRFAFGTHEPSFAMRTSDESFTIASEPMDEVGWEEVPTATIVNVRAGERFVVEHLPAT